MSWTGNVLRVNLDVGTCATEPTNMEWAHDYMGQRGLATKYLVEETDPKVDPLSPENKMIFATGPLTSTIAPTSGRWSVICKGTTDGGHCLLEFGRVFWCGVEKRRLGYGDF
jgi:aldehyde:ferredoxin oxidoreductase